MTEEQARAHPGVLAGTHRAIRDARKLGGWSTQDVALKRASNARYAQTPNRKAREKARRRTPEGRALSAKARARYARTAKGQSTLLRWKRSPEGKASLARSLKKYNATPKGKARSLRADRKRYGTDKRRASGRRATAAWFARHPLRRMLYDARRAVKKTKLRLEELA